MALLLTLGVVAGAGGAAAGYYLVHSDAEDARVTQVFTVELQPTAPGAYQVFLPVPSRNGQAAPGFALQLVEGEARFGLVRTEHGLALSVRAEGPVRLAAAGELPMRLSLDDVPTKHRQFRFWGYLGRDAPAPVLLKLEVREHNHTASWDRHMDLQRSILLQDPLEPDGWQVLRATHVFDFAAGLGYGGAFPRLALGAVGVSAAGLYPPLGLIALGWRRKPA